MPITIKQKKKPVTRKMRQAPKKPAQNTQGQNVVTTLPAAYNTTSISKPPSFGGNSTVVSHREITIETIAATSAFDLQYVVALQPSLTISSRGSPMGSWLPKVAAGYDNYEFLKLKFHFITSLATNQNGMLIMSYDPNPDGTSPTSFTSMKNSYSATGNMRTNLTFDLTSKVRGRKLLTRTAAVNALPLYDVGKLFIATMNGGASTAGYIEVEYSVRFSNPQTAPRLDSVAAQLTPTVFYLTPTANMGSPGTQLFFGPSAALRASTMLFRNILGYNLTPLTPGQGATSLITDYVNAGRTASYDFTSIYGIRHCTITNLGVCAVSFARLGKYRITGVLAGDWQDMACFGAEVYEWPSKAAVLNTNPTLAVDAVLDSNDEVVYIPSSYAGWRGFKTTYGPGSSDDCDEVPTVSLTFTVTDLLKFYTLSVGVRYDTNVSESATAWYIFDTRSGVPSLRIEYLGSV